jgi:hypothetical protein
MSKNISFFEAEYVSREFAVFNRQLKEKLDELQKLVVSKYDSPMTFPTNFKEKFYREITNEMIGERGEEMDTNHPFTHWALEKCAKELLDKPKRRWFRL